MDGYVFDFKRFSTHDGNGIRTTIFLKGCTLKCVWCQNPEGISIKQRPLYFPTKCIHCNTCVNMSKNGGVYEKDGQIKLDISKDENWEEIVDSFCKDGMFYAEKDDELELLITPKNAHMPFKEFAPFKKVC